MFASSSSTGASANVDEPVEIVFDKDGAFSLEYGTDGIEIDNEMLSMPEMADLILTGANYFSFIDMETSTFLTFTFSGDNLVVYSAPAEGTYSPSEVGIANLTKTLIANWQ